jgi:hypothetical protein
MLGDHHPLLGLFDISHKFRETVPGVCQWQFGHSQKYRQIFGTRDDFQHEPLGRREWIFDPVSANGVVAAVASTETDGVR